jgi:hypothetical protein
MMLCKCQVRVENWSIMSKQTKNFKGDSSKVTQEETNFKGKDGGQWERSQLAWSLCRKYM